MSPRFKGQWRPSLFKLMLMIVLLVPLHYTEATTNNNKRSQQQQQSQQTDVDLMEPCYLANNRASESLTISESTPVGTVVGELLVNGDPSTNGNIELSIKMPASGGQQLVASASDSNRQQQQQLPVGTQPQQTNGYSSATKRLGSQVINSQQVADNNNNNRHASQHRAGQQVAATQRSARDLSSIIELMPPLSIEHRTKRLILAKKLDRENLDRYAAAGQQLTSSVQSGASGSSSASLTVHVKCQLRGVPAAESDSNNRTNSPEKISAAASKSSSSNSILIPIHLIVTDENDNWPIFINSPYIIDLNETVPIGSPLPGNEIVAVDNDQQGPLSTIEYSIVPGSLYSDTFAFLNPLDSRSLIVKDNHLLDYESQSKLTLKVMARDQGEPSNWAITSLYINLFDNDDLSPVFNEDRYFGQVKENRPGEIIELQPRRLQARDADKTINAPIVYSFHAKTNHSIHFELDAELARLSLKKTLPDNQQPFCLLIRATQADDPLRWTLAAVQVRLASSTRGELEQLLAVAVEGQQTVEAPSTGSGPLRFARSNYTVEVSELAPPGFTVLNLRALHNDKEAADIHYQLLDDDAGHFKLDQRTGALTLNRSIDYEMYRRVSVRVLATYEYYSTTAAGSGGARLNHHHQSASNNNQALPAPSTTITSTYPNLVCDTTRVSVIVINQNDHKPEFSHDQYNLQLSVSDLIASFDPPTGKAPGEPGGDEAALQVASQSIDRLQSNKELLKRFGETDQLDESAEEPFGWRAMQLGQVYCADRDFGDKVTLQLTGSKANLFHLTQDGRLYLPLVNVSSLAGSGGLAGTGGQLSRKVDSSSTWLASHHARTINNQLVPSKVFFSRRQDRQNLEPPDRDYLNYLLGELSNLGRLRLKVLASDDGQPQAQTSTAIIVISIISIDNFIIQRALLPPKWQPSAASPEATNQTQDVNELQPESSNRSIQQQQQQFDYARQVMMIPATNGRSFVQINPDIVSNLILQNGGSSAKTDTTNSQLATGGRQQSSSTVLQPEQLSGQPTPPVGDTGTYGQQTKFQPPSLLLVDDDGAKFVAMPAAIEVYNQQVQEAADLLQARQRNQAHLSETSKRLLREADESLWARWKAHFGFSNRDISGAQQGGFLYWINLSSAIMLHLIGLAIIITLLAKLRSSLSTESRTMASLGPRLSWFSHGLSGGGIGNPGGGFVPGDSATGGPDLHSKYSGSQRMSSSENSLGSSYAFMTNHQLDPQQQHLQNLSQQHYVNSSNSSQTSSDSDHSATCSSSYLAGKTVSAGVMVSAASNGGLRRAAATAAASPRIGRDLEWVSSNKQSNLFGHLKLTLNKMLDLGEAKPDHSDCGQVTVKALDSDSASFNSFTTDTQPNSSNFASTSAAVEAAKRALPELAKSSTFVGSQQSANSPNSQLDSGAANIVSISVVAVPSAKPPAVELRPNLSPNRKSQRLKSTGAAGNSSSSSVVSLVSMSSSISNKINAAVERTSEHNTGSDASSLDSSTLFNSNQHLLTRANHVLNQTPVPETTSPKRRENTPAPTPAPPPPPPPPPPPSLVQVGMDSLSLQSLTSVNVAGNSLVLNDQRQLSKPFSSRPTEMTDNQRAEVTCSPLSPRRPLPQNPVHVRLRQQAAAEQQQAVAAAEKSRKQPAPSKKPPAPQPINLSANRKQTNEERQVAPPTPPPPPPSSLSTSSTKTISPTTSVDRGYESLQSYTSSSYNQQSQQKQQRSEGTTVGEKPIAGGGSRDLSNEFANTKQQQQWSTGATNSVVGRQSQRTQKLQVLAGSSAGSGEPTTKQQLEQEQQQSAATKHHLLKGRDSDRVIRSSRTLALGAAAAAAQQGLNAPRQLHLPINTGQVQKVANRFRSAKVRTQRFRSSASQQAQQTPVKQQQQQGGYETEDEDFYYCYSNGSRATQTDTTCAPQRHLSSAAQVALAANNPILSDYVSHAYTQRNQAQPHQQQVVELVGSGRARATHNGLDLMLNGESAQHLSRNQRATTIQQVVALPNHHHHHQQQQQQHHLHQLQHQRQPSNAVYCANNKKQLTWSDQVRIA